MNKEKIRPKIFEVVKGIDRIIGINNNENSFNENEIKFSGSYMGVFCVFIINKEHKEVEIFIRKIFLELNKSEESFLYKSFIEKINECIKEKNQKNNEQTLKEQEETKKLFNSIDFSHLN